MRITVDCANHNFRIVQGAWEVMTRNVGNRRVFHLSITARGYTKLEEYPAKMGNCDLEALETQADFGDISEVRQVPPPQQDRRKNRMGNMENDMANLEDMFTSYLNSAVGIFSGREMVDRAKMMNDLREIDN